MGHYIHSVYLCIPSNQTEQCYKFTLEMILYQENMTLYYCIQNPVNFAIACLYLVFWICIYFFLLNCRDMWCFMVNSIM